MAALRVAARALRRSPIFACVSICSLALGIGANLAVFSLVDALLLRPLPVADPTRLVRVGRTTPDAAFATVSYLELRDLRQSVAPLADLVGHYPGTVILATSSEPRTAWIELVTANYFNVLGVQPSLGRAFAPDDERAAGASPVIVLSHELWKQRFNGDAGVIGRAVRVNGRTFTVVGVAPSFFRGTFTGFNIDAWVPVTMQRATIPSAGSLEQRDDRFLMMLARVHRGVSMDQLRSALAVVAARLNRERRDSMPSGHARFDVAPATGLHPFIAGLVTAFLGLLQGIVLLVLLIACVNLANVLLVRASARRRELAVRVALGATRWRLAQLLLAESLLLAVAGGAAGVGLAALVARLVDRLHLDIGIPLGLHIGLDARVLIAAVAMTLVTALAFGIGPALAASRGDVLADLRVAGATTERKHSRVRAMLVAAQVIVATVLLTGSGLMLRSLRRSADLKPGFDASRVHLLAASPELLGYDETRGRALWEEIAARAERADGVRAALALFVPLGNRGDLLSVGAVGGARPEPRAYNIVGPGYFSLLDIPIVAGRAPKAADRRGAPDVAVVSEAMARNLFGRENAVGRTVQVVDRAGRARPMEIVGVARDIKLRSLGEPPQPIVYMPFGQWYRPDMVLHVRIAGNSALALREVLAEMHAREPDLAIDVQSMEEATQFSLIPLRVAGSVLGFSSIVGLLLATLGVFGLVAYEVTLRTREIGIRMALGAQRASVLTLAVRRGLRPVFVGLAIGLVAAIGVGLVLRGLLVGIGLVDPLTLIGVAVALLGSAAAAVSGPAWRAVSIDPARVLREE